MIIGAFVLVASLFVILVLERQAKSHYADGVILVAPRIDDAWYHVPRARVDGLASFFPEHSIVGVTRNRQRLSADLHNAVAWVYHISPGYFDMYQVDFTEGRAQFYYDEIVLNKPLAWQLFGNTENVVGLRVVLLGEVYTVCGVVHKGDGPAAWRIASDEMAMALYVRANEHDPLAVATARRILSDHLFVNPDDYYVIDVGRVAGSMGIRARILVVFVLLAIATGVLICSFAMIRRRRDLICILHFGGFCMCVAIVAAILNGVLAWLPNPAVIDVSMFGYVFFPAASVYLAGLSMLVNVVFVVGVAVVLFLCYTMSIKFEANTPQPMSLRA